MNYETEFYDVSVWSQPSGWNKQELKKLYCLHGVVQFVILFNRGEKEM